MASNENQQVELRRREYDLRRAANLLATQLSETTDAEEEATLQTNLIETQSQLQELEREIAGATGADPASGRVMRTHSQTRSGADIDVQVFLRMAQVPTAICHLLDRSTHPLIECHITGTKSQATKRGGAQPNRRVVVRCYVQEYSADAVTTLALQDGVATKVTLLPTFFAERMRTISELTRATLHLIVKEVDENREIFHETRPIWIMSRNSAPLAVKDPKTGLWNDLTRYFGAFVTPNQASIMSFLRHVARAHLEGRLVGYQGNVESQIRAIFAALKENADITYVNSLIDFNPDQSAASQRVRLPRESLADRQANCIDGTLLFASLLEAISLNPAIVVVPHHVFVGWETGPESGQWRYLETTMIGTSTYEEALESGLQKAKLYASQRDTTGDEAWFRRWSVRDLRTVHQITPME